MVDKGAHAMGANNRQTINRGTRSSSCLERPILMARANADSITLRAINYLRVIHPTSVAITNVAIIQLAFMKRRDLRNFATVKRLWSDCSEDETTWSALTCIFLLSLAAYKIFPFQIS